MVKGKSAKEKRQHSRSSDRSQSRTPCRRRRRGSCSRSRSRSPNLLRQQVQALQYVAQGDARRLRKLLRRAKEHPVVTTADSQGRTLLHQACACGHAEIAALLLRYGASAAAVDTSGDTPAHAAARRGHLEVLAELLRAPNAPALDALGAGGAMLRELMARALQGGAASGEEAAGRGPGGVAEWHGGVQAGNGEEGPSEGEDARWQRRLREECSEGEEEVWEEGTAAAGESDDEWADRLWRQMCSRRAAAAAASSAAFTADLRAEAARRVAEATERSRRILQEEQAKDASWRRRTLAAIEAGPPAPPLDLMAARVAYDERWAQLDSEVAAAGSTASSTAAPALHEPFGYWGVPWPLDPPARATVRSAQTGPCQAGPHAAASLPPPAQLPPPPSVDSLRDFLLLGARGPSDVKRRLRAELLRWHPDKFGARFGARLAAAGPGQREAALARVQQLAQVLTQVLGRGGGGGG